MTIDGLKTYLQNPKQIFVGMGAKGWLNWIPDEQYLKIAYSLRFGKTLNLDAPMTFNEKTQWLKLYNRNPLYTKLVDKYKVRKYIAEEIGEQYLIPLVGGPWKSFDEIDFDNLPNQYVLKCNHDSGGLVICRDKSKIDKAAVREKIERCLQQNYYFHGREWAYRNVPPQIIAEKYMADGTDAQNELTDYKLFSFAGKVQLVQVDYNRFTDHHRNFYSREWEYLPFTTCYPTNINHTIPRPSCLKELIDIGEKLSNSVGAPPFLRVDMYLISGQIYFGELTLYHGGGFEKFDPPEWDAILGSWLELPEKPKQSNAMHSAKAIKK